MTVARTERPASLGERPPPAGVPMLRRLVLAAVVALSVVLVVPAGASAQSSEQDSSAYLGTWTSRSGAMTLHPDSTGDLTISNDSGGGEAWSLRWSSAPGSIIIELRTRALLDGTGYLGDPGPGTWWYAALQRSEGVTVLRLTNPAGSSALGTYWCNRQAYGSTDICTR